MFVTVLVMPQTRQSIPSRVWLRQGRMEHLFSVIQILDICQCIPRQHCITLLADILLVIYKNNHIIVSHVVLSRQCSLLYNYAFHFFFLSRTLPSFLLNSIFFLSAQGSSLFRSLLVLSFTWTRFLPFAFLNSLILTSSNGGENGMVAWLQATM